MNYAIIRNEKYKRGNLKGIYRHNERKNTNYSNKNIDSERTPLNYHIKKPTFSYEKEFEKVKSEYNLKGQIKEVSNIVCEYIITSSKDFFDDIGEAETKRKRDEMESYVLRVNLIELRAEGCEYFKCTMETKQTTKQCVLGNLYGPRLSPPLAFL